MAKLIFVLGICLMVLSGSTTIVALVRVGFDTDFNLELLALVIFLGGIPFGIGCVMYLGAKTNIEKYRESKTPEDKTDED